MHLNKFCAHSSDDTMTIMIGLTLILCYRKYLTFDCISVFRCCLYHARTVYTIFQLCSSFNWPLPLLFDCTGTTQHSSNLIYESRALIACCTSFSRLIVLLFGRLHRILWIESGRRLPCNNCLYECSSQRPNTQCLRKRKQLGRRKKEMRCI